MKKLSYIKQKAKQLKQEIGALYLAYKRPDVPLYAKLVAIIVVGYALSPIDLIPDFIPILGYLDDVILIPLGIMLAIKLIPCDIMNECRKESEEIFSKGKPKNWVAGAIVIGLWVVVLTLIIIKIINYYFSQSNVLSASIQYSFGISPREVSNP